MLSPLKRKHFTVGIGWGRKLSGEVIQLPVSWESPYYMFVKQVMLDIRKKNCKQTWQGCELSNDNHLIIQQLFLELHQK